MTRLRVVFVAAWMLLAFSVSGCGNQAPPESTTGGETTQQDYENFDPANFENSAHIDNPWMPLTPGTRLTWEGSSMEDEGLVPHRLVLTVTDLTKVIGGVQALVCWDQDVKNTDELVESEIAFFAQDKDGTVWYLGEYPEEYENGEFVKAPFWIHGVEGARAGVAMPANPQMGTPSYSQGWAPHVPWTDRGVVHEMGQTVSVPAGNYDDVLVISESNREEPDAQQFKYYARGVGNVRVGWAGEDEPTKETLELVKAEQLDAAGMAEARSKALELEKHAYERDKDTYGQTEPVQPMGGS